MQEASSLQQPRIVAALCGTEPEKCLGVFCNISDLYQRANIINRGADSPCIPTERFTVAQPWRSLVTTTRVLWFVNVLSVRAL